jgi:membrane protein implicated in regulation of membrane protease activity
MSQIQTVLEQLGPWAWWIAGLILLGLELLLPGNVLVWFGIAAMLTGLEILIVDFGWQVSWLIFAVLSAILVIVGRRYFARDNRPGEQPFLNDRARRLVGGTYILSRPIVDGQGQIRVDDTNWRVTGPDLPSGTRVRVAGADGAVLAVERVE